MDIKTLLYQTDARRFLKKWLIDLKLQQKEDGCVPIVIPEMGYVDLFDGSAGWGDAAVTVPYTLYRMYGDISIPEQQYSSMKKYVDFMDKRAENENSDKNAFWWMI